MSQKMINTTIPLSPTDIATYCKNNKKEIETEVIFDINHSDLYPEHIMNYLAHLKIPCKMTNFNSRFLLEYMTSSYMIGESNMIKHHANILYYYIHDTILYEDILDEFSKEHVEQFVSKNVIKIQEQIEVLFSLPIFLLQNSIPGFFTDNIDEKRHRYVGVNFAHLVQLDEFFIKLLNEKIFDYEDQNYYTQHFDEYIYGGYKLIQYFIDNPNNLLTKIPEFQQCDVN